jgi:TonB family protein
MNSVVQGSGGPVVRVGNTTYGDPNGEKFVDPSQVKPYAGGQPGFKAAKASSLSQEARVVRDFKAPYPKELADQGVEGAVQLLVEVTKDGRVNGARVVKTSGNKTLDALALDAVKKFVFAPAEVDGEKVDSLLRYTYRFELFD